MVVYTLQVSTKHDPGHATDQDKEPRAIGEKSAKRYLLAAKEACSDLSYEPILATHCNDKSYGIKAVFGSACSLPIKILLYATITPTKSRGETKVQSRPPVTSLGRRSVSAGETGHLSPAWAQPLAITHNVLK